jgi:hypothetical protein
LIIKPSVSYASISISDKSIVDNKTDALLQIRKLMNSSLGDCNLTNEGGIFVESFLAGREFTVLCTGSAEYGVTGKDTIMSVYPAAERVFNKNLKERERILAFEKCSLNSP